VAKLPVATISTILELQHRLIDSIDSVTETEFKLFMKHGETAQTLSELEELQSIKEKIEPVYSQLNVLLLKVAESQPIASDDVLNLLYSSTIEMAEVVLGASAASLREIQNNWRNL
jgi:hypothetical protein